MTSKDKFCGQVYLELTFWSNVSYMSCLESVKRNLRVALQERPPEKKPTKSKQYGGPGSFVPLGDAPSTLQSVDESGVQSSRISSMSSIQDHSRHTSNTIPPSLRASSSLARLDLYVPPYQSSLHGSVLDHITNDFGQLEVVDHRRDSFPVSRSFHSHCHSSNVLGLDSLLMTDIPNGLRLHSRRFLLNPHIVMNRLYVQMANPCTLTTDL